jgi:hypothetical protein
MPTLPANFFSRSELQRILTRAGDLLGQTENTALHQGLQQLMQGAACVEGVLADLPVTPHPVDRALENPNGWSMEWRESHGTVHHAGPPAVEFSLARQFIIRPDRASVPTGRYRVSLGDKTYTGTDMPLLRNLTVCYLTCLGVRDPLREQCLNCFFDVIGTDEPAGRPNSPDATGAIAAGLTAGRPQWPHWRG